MNDWKNMNIDKLTRKQAIEVIGSIAGEMGDALEQATNRILQQQNTIEQQTRQIRELRNRIEAGERGVQ